MGVARFTFKEADMIAAQRDWWMGAARWQVFLKAWGGIGFVYALIGLATAWDSAWRIRIGAVGFALLIAFAVAVVLFAIGYILSPYRARRAFREHKAIKGDFVNEWNSEGISIRYNQGQTTLPWNMFHAWMIGSQTVMLYQTSVLFNAIPRRAIGDADIAQIVANLRGAAVPERKRFGILSWKPHSPSAL